MFVAPEGERIRAADRRATVDALVSEAAGGSQGDRAVSPSAAGAVSDDASTAYATVTCEVGAGDPADSGKDALEGAVDEARAAGLAVEAGGTALAGRPAAGGSAEAAGIALAAVVPLTTFGSSSARARRGPPNGGAPHAPCRCGLEPGAMSIRPWVIVEAPDRRGLRRVVVGGETVGSVWSLRELRRLLVGIGCPEDTDLEDPASVCWRGGGSGTWPDRAGRRRATIVLMAAGMLASMVLNAVVGWPDAHGALTFAQRLSGGLFVLSGLVEGAAAVAALDYWGKRQAKSSGAVVLVGVLVALTTDSLLLFLWADEREYTPYLLVFTPLWCWSVCALWLLVRERAWRGMPRPKTFAAGVVATALLTAVSLAYSTLYQPAAAPMHFMLKADFGTARTDSLRLLMHVPLKLHVKNSGGIPVYVVIDDYTVYGRSAEYSEGADRLEEWKRSLDEREPEDAERYVNRLTFRKISSGRLFRPGDWLEVGQEFSMERVVQIPTTTEFDRLDVVLQVTYMRKDRGKIDVTQFRRRHRSWDKAEGRYYCAPEKCGEEIYYHGRVRHNNNLVNVTRKPRYVTAIWSLREPPRYSISSFDFKGKVALSEERRDLERYGAATASVESEVSVAELLGSAEGGGD
ncbi:hypothetical protein ACIF8T_25320 [Streptomyces sp. NPDC085946]|uniref:hypothetical protein n=1 Tax=Streptomyces sp. NPDC085946 TaxID=3365744 RepID=UPI0037D52B13